MNVRKSCQICIWKITKDWKVFQSKFFLVWCAFVCWHMRCVWLCVCACVLRCFLYNHFVSLNLNGRQRKCVCEQVNFICFFLHTQRTNRKKMNMKNHIFVHLLKLLECLVCLTYSPTPTCFCFLTISHDFLCLGYEFINNLKSFKTIPTTILLLCIQLQQQQQLIKKKGNIMMVAARAPKKKKKN